MKLAPTPLTDALIDVALITNGKVASAMRKLERENRRLTNLLDRACTAAGMSVIEEGRHNLLADKVRVMRDELDADEDTERLS